jgi:hypothetical protein
LPIDTRFVDKQFAQLATDLQSRPHGKTILICWHHGEIPALVGALGADPHAVLPTPKWPENVFGWVIVLQYDHTGQLTRSELVHENLMPDDAGQ